MRLRHGGRSILANRLRSLLRSRMNIEPGLRRQIHSGFKGNIGGLLARRFAPHLLPKSVARIKRRDITHSELVDDPPLTDP